MQRSVGKNINVIDTRTDLNFLMLKEECAQEEIKRAYRKAAMVCHPDKPGGKAKVFNKVNECYNWLVEHGSVIPKPKPRPSIVWRVWTKL